MHRTASVACVLALALSAAALALTTARTVDPALYDASIHPRYWADMRIAIGLWRTGYFPVLVRHAGGPEGFYGADRDVKRAARHAGLTAWSAWRTLPEDAFTGRDEVRVVRRFDDSGRPLLAGLGFGVLGGVAPLLPLWLGFLVTVPILTWTSLELLYERRPVAAALFPLLVGLCPFIPESLALSYSSAGFHIATALTLCALAIPCFGTRTLTVGGLLLRAAAAGAAFAVCTLCRSGSLTLTPGFAIALLVAGIRVGGGGARARLVRTGLVTLGAAAIFTAPLLLARREAGERVEATYRAFGEGAPEPQQHAFWWGMWTGLGDFDRTKGYRWRDRSAAAAVATAGGPQVTGFYYDPRAERVLRDVVTRDILQDPGWYAGILVRRVLATVTLRKLWPWGPISGRSMRPSTSWNEGVMDAYYALVTPVDWAGAGGVRWEWPVPILLAPSWCLVAWAALGRRAPGATEALRDVALLATIGAATLLMPVVVSTASGIEPQVFALTYLAGTAMFVDRLFAAAARRSASRRSTIRP